MGRASTIAIHPFAIQPAGPRPLGAAPVGCGHCHHAQGASGCGSYPPPAAHCATTETSGPADEVARVMAGLGRRLGFAPEAPEQAGVRALRITPDEVELELAWPAHCGGIEFAETAFNTLRGLMPDTDIYVTHAR